MHIQVTDVWSNEETNLVVVEFSTPFGIGVGEWHGDTMPERYSHHDVEIETASPMTWGKEITSVGEDSFIIDYDINHLVTLQGKLESVEPDGAAYLRIGQSLVMLETTGNDYPALDTFIRVHADKVLLFPYEL